MVDGYESIFGMIFDSNHSTFCFKEGTMSQKSDMDKAVALHQAGKLGQAKSLYLNILRNKAEDPNVLHLYGVCEYQLGNNRKAVNAISRAISLIGGHPLFLNSLGVIYKDGGDCSKALHCFIKAIELKPDYAEAYYNAGGAYFNLKRYINAIESYKNAIGYKANFAEAYNNLAAVLNITKRYPEAEAYAQQAIRINPKYSDAYNNLGNSKKELGQLEAAIAYYRKAIRLVGGNPEIYCNLGNALYDQGNAREAIEAYQNALNSDAKYGKAHNNIGIVYRNRRHFKKAINHFNRSISLMPDNPEAYHNMGNVYYDMAKYEQAAKWYEKAISIDPELSHTLINLGIVCQEDGQADKAFAFFYKAMEKYPESSKACAHLVHALYVRCEWHQLDELNAKMDRLAAFELANGIRPGEMPFLSLIRTPDPAINYRIAKSWSVDIRRRVETQYSPSCDGPGTCSGEKITIGYLSNNFRNHPTAHLIGDIFRLHDRDRFSINVYSYGNDDGSIYRERIRKRSDRFVDMQYAANKDFYKQIVDDGVNILVDLVGYMQGNRLEVCACRPAPVQVRWLGLAGTTGADFFDYILTDRIVTPKEQAPFYSEKFVYLPDTYQVNSKPLFFSDAHFNRNDVGLPENGFVYCCFCSNYKIEPVMFQTWMQVLKGVPNSVLWLLKSNAMVEENLKREANEKGVDPDRLIFAEKISKEDHLQRIRLADFAIDTRIINGAATTSDALYAGVPVLSLKGTHFASRMSSSILNAVGMNELIVSTLSDYTKSAIEFGANPEKCKALKERLQKNLKTQALFHTGRFVRNLEKAYLKMWERYCDGKAPQMIRIEET